MSKAHRQAKKNTSKKKIFLPFTLEEFDEFLSDAALSKMRKAHENGHAIAALDALLCCTDTKRPLPEWTLNELVRRQYVAGTKRGRHARPWQEYLQHLKDAIRYEAVRQCEKERYQKRQDKFERAFELLGGTWAAAKDSSGIKKSFYKFRKKAEHFYLSYQLWRTQK